MQHYFWALDEVNQLMESIMVRSFAEVTELARKESVTRRDAAMLLAVQEILPTGLIHIAGQTNRIPFLGRISALAMRAEAFPVVFKARTVISTT